MRAVDEDEILGRTERRVVEERAVAKVLRDPVPACSLSRQARPIRPRSEIGGSPGCVPSSGSASPRSSVSINASGACDAIKSVPAPLAVPISKMRWGRRKDVISASTNASP